MKTNYLFFVLVAAGIICSCEREAEITETESPQPEISTEVIIHATMAQDGNTKTILQDDGAVFWQPGDQIAVFFNTIRVPFTAFNSVDAASAYFVGNMDISTGHNEGSDGSMAGEYVYWGLYPLNATIYEERYDTRSFYYDNDAIWSSIMIKDGDVSNEFGGSYTISYTPSHCSGKEISTILYDWQKGVENTFDTQLNIALAKSDDYHEFSFYNVLGGLRFTVQSSDITRVTFKGNNGEALAGRFSVKMDDNGKPLITEVSIPSEAITVSLENNETFKPGVWYYAMMFPGTLSNGYTLEVYKGNKKATKVVSTEAQVKRSTFGSLSNIDANLDFDEDVIFPTGFSDYPYITPVYISIGQEVQLKANVTPENCTFPVKWFSLDPSIITVSTDGKAVGLSTGIGEIICVIDNQSASTSIHVLGEDECLDIIIQAPEGIDLYELFIGDHIQLTAVPDPVSCTGTVVWSSSDESVATVDQNGLVTVVGLGDVAITAKIGDTSAEIYLYSRVDPSEAELWQFIRLNEMYPGGSDDEKYIELYNICDSPVNLRGFYLKKDESDSPSWVGIAGEVIPAHGFFAIVGAKGTTDRGFDSGFSTKKSILWELYAPDKTRVDLFQRGDKDETGSWGVKLPEVSGASWSRIPDGTGEWMITSVTTLGEANSTEGTVDTDIKYY